VVLVLEILFLNTMTKIKNLLIAEARGNRRTQLLALAAKKAPTKRSLIMKLAGVPKRMPTQFYNKKGRQFFLTMKGKYVLRQDGKSLYGRKATDPRAPMAIRLKKRVP
jgi:hypothetical protein